MCQPVKRKLRKSNRKLPCIAAVSEDYHLGDTQPLDEVQLVTEAQPVEDTQPLEYIRPVIDVQSDEAKCSMEFSATKMGDGERDVLVETDSE